MMIEAKYFHGIGTFDVYLSKVSALDFSHPPACPILTFSVPFGDGGNPSP